MWRNISDVSGTQTNNGTVSKIQEGMRAEMRKLQAEMTEHKTLVGQMKNSLEGLTNIVTVVEDRILSSKMNY